MTKDEIEKLALEIATMICNSDSRYADEYAHDIAAFGQECFDAGVKQAEKLNAAKVQNLFKHL